MNGAQNDIETGRCVRSKGAVEYDPDPEKGYNPPVPKEAYVILWGDDIQEYHIQGYRNGGCEAGEELDDLTCTVTRYETTLGQLLYELIQRDWSDEEGVDLAMLYGLTAELLVTSGPLSEHGAQRYSFGSLSEVISEVYRHMRVMYLSCEITIPAGGSVVVQAEMRKNESHDFYGDKEYRDGYALATRMGSALQFTGQTAELKHAEQIQIVDQNFGFDPEKGVTCVTLDPTVEHYWMEVQKRETN